VKGLASAWKYQILRTVYPESDEEILHLVQNDTRRTQNDIIHVSAYRSHSLLFSEDLLKKALHSLP
jgi:hypothetical protein